MGNGVLPAGDICSSEATMMKSSRYCRFSFQLWTTAVGLNKDLL